MENVYVNSFIVEENDFETMKEALNYLDSSEGMYIVYSARSYLCTLDSKTYLDMESFNEEIPRAIVSSTKSLTSS
jgi:hypothetical protein